ncbi:hypothetical protein A6U96_13935 [Agrobacterium tumefaciens]|nr:hypothetical protein A6U96_13935 [Agrobacterium tumefaciens]
MLYNSNVYGVWLKNGNDEKLVFTDTKMACQHYTEVETAKNPTLAHKWRIRLLPKARVSLKTYAGPVIIAAFDSDIDATFFVSEFVKINNIDHEQVGITVAP